LFPQTIARETKRANSCPINQDGSGFAAPDISQSLWIRAFDSPVAGVPGVTRGKMKPQIDLRNARLSLCLPKSSTRIKFAGVSRIASALAAVCMPLVAVSLSAQQPPDQYWPPDDAYNGQPAPAPQQYAPGQPYGYAQPQYPQPQTYPQQDYGSLPGNYPQQGNGQPQLMQSLSPDELAQLVAPIALYPDALVAQILAAATYPAQLLAADQWRRSMGNAPPEQIAAGADAQSNWDPSIKALTAFPQVLAMMNQNLQWTTSLGNAYYNQPQDVMQTIQVMRQRAEEAGNLQSTPQEDVSNNQGYIGIAPVDPQVVYVPTYNPWAVYGQPVSPYPGFSLIGALGSFFGSSPVQYGLSFAMSAFLHTPWGWLGWGLDWLAHSVLFNHSDYSTHSTSVADWGLPHGGPRAYPGRPDWGRGGGRYGWSRDGYNRAYGQPAAGFNRGNGRPIGRPIEHWGDARTAQGFNRGFPARGATYERPALPQQAYNHFPQPVGRPQAYEPRSQAYAGRQEQYGRQGYGSYNAPHDNYVSRPGLAFASPSQSYRAPENTYPRGGFGARGYEGYGGSEAWKPQHSGGFHMFGGRSSDGFSMKAPKAYSYGGGHSGWGGSGGWKAPKESHSGGGGHSFDGGGHSGGGHSGGGHGHHH
jgi:hypothetical protein